MSIDYTISMIVIESLQRESWRKLSKRERDFGRDLRPLDGELPGFNQTWQNLIGSVKIDRRFIYFFRFLKKIVDRG